MRPTLPSFTFAACLCLWSSAAYGEPVQATIDAYINQVGAIASDALTPEFAKHRELVTGITEFSFRINPDGHPSEIKAVSRPRNQFVEQTILRVIHDLKFPQIPKRILRERGLKYLEFRNRISPPSPVASLTNRSSKPRAATRQG